VPLIPEGKGGGGERPRLQDKPFFAATVKGGGGGKKVLRKHLRRENLGFHCRLRREKSPSFPERKKKNCLFQL